MPFLLCTALVCGVSSPCSNSACASHSWLSQGTHFSTASIVTNALSYYEILPCRSRECQACCKGHHSNFPTDINANSLKTASREVLVHCYNSVQRNIQFLAPKGCGHGIRVSVRLVHVVSFPGLLHLQFLIACSMQKWR